MAVVITVDIVKSGKFPALLSLLNFIAVLAIWYVFLFSVQCDCASVFESAKQDAIYALTPSTPGSIFFIGTLVSAAASLISTILFLVRKPRLAIGVVALNTLSTLFLFDFALVVLTGLPLLLGRQVWKR